ncbi:MAG: bifunctional oligoribonuclease/PAP phosphatase NrnA [Bacteroidetes bacterium]|nr:bifunctional oligoribonuclease/PAP phosphatase NrnA [Bacteroidota bacterium]
MKHDDSGSIRSILTTDKKILITCHSNPDGDAIGSSLALMHALRSLGHMVDILVPNDYPTFLAWMPGIQQIVVFKHKLKEAMKLAVEADIIFCMDYQGLKRVEKMEVIWKETTAVKVMIDHHPHPDVAAFQYLISNSHTSSTSELVYDFIFQLGGEKLITKEISECLFVGIATDTGSFSYSCNYEKTFLVIAELLRKGIDVEKIHRMVYDTYSENRMRLLGYCLSEKLKVLPEFGTAYIYLSKEDLKRFKFQVGDTEGVVNYALSIKGICLAVLFTERDNFIRMNFRSKGKFSVNEFVKKHFEGGGHKNAAGGNSYLSLQETLSKFEALLPEYQQELQSCFYQ